MSNVSNHGMHAALTGTFVTRLCVVLLLILFLLSLQRNAMPDVAVDVAVNTDRHHLCDVMTLS